MAIKLKIAINENKLGFLNAQDNFNSNSNSIYHHVYTWKYNYPAHVSGRIPELN